MSFVLLIVSTTVAQEVYKDKHFTINTTKPKYQSYYYTLLIASIWNTDFIMKL